MSTGSRKIECEGKYGKVQEVCVHYGRLGLNVEQQHVNGVELNSGRKAQPSRRTLLSLLFNFFFFFFSLLGLCASLSVCAYENWRRGVLLGGTGDNGKLMK